MSRTDPRSEAKWIQIQQDEHDLILRRRQAVSGAANNQPAGRSGVQSGENPSPGNSDAVPLDESLVGLAFSGGGVRSGAFNLGLSQAFHDKNVLPQIDYLSTVSGGGYAGAHLTSLGCHPESRFGWDPSASSESQVDKSSAGIESSGERLPTSSSNLKKQKKQNPVDDTLGAGAKGLWAAPELRRMASDCRYLTRLDHFLNKQIIGSLLLCLVAGSGLCLVTALLAWLLRSLDAPDTSLWLSSLGVRGDTSRAMLPAIVIWLCWAISWVLSFFRDRQNARGTVARVLLWGAVATTAMSLTLLATTGDVSLNRDTVSRTIKEDADFSELWNLAAKVIGIGLATALIPYLNPKALIRSAASPRTGAHGLVYHFASVSLLFGAPLALLWVFAAEDISDYQEDRVDWIPGIIKDQKALSLTGESISIAEREEIAKRIKNLEKRKAKQSPSATDRFDAKTVMFTETHEPDRNVKDRLSKRKIPLEPFQASTRPDIPSSALSDWSQFWNFVDRSRQPDTNDGTQRFKLADGQDWLPPILAEQLWTVANAVDVNGVPKQNVDDYSMLDESRRLFKRLREYHVKNGLFHTLSHSIFRSDEERPFEQQHEFRLQRRQILGQINALLADPKLFELFEFVDPPKTETLDDTQKQRLQEFRNLIKTAKAHDAHLTSLVSTDSTLASNAYLPLVSWFPKEWVNELWLSIRHTGQKLWPASSDKPWTRQQSEEYYGKAIRSLTEGKELVPKEKLAEAEEVATLYGEIRKTNRALLQKCLSTHIKDPSTVFSSVCQQADQQTRLNYALWFGVVFLVSGFLINLNAISLQSVYQTALSKAWIVDSADNPGSRLELNQLVHAVDRGCPYPLINGTVTLGSDWRRDVRRERFLFSPLYCGSENTGWISSGRYADCGICLPDAMALSGAAVSTPQIADLLGKALLILGNVRMGAWMPNPKHPGWTSSLDEMTPIGRGLLKWWRLLPASPLRMLGHQLACRWLTRPDSEPYVHVGDGGFYENLGLEPLLKRRCRLIIVSDATADPDYTFEDLARSIELTSGMAHLLPLKTDDTHSESIAAKPQLHGFSVLQPGKTTRLSRQHWVIRGIVYLDDSGHPLPFAKEQKEHGWLVYVKPSLTGDEDELEDFGLRFLNLQSQFPQDPTSDQVFDDRTFESYRRLGYHIGQQLSGQFKSLAGCSDLMSLHSWNPPAPVKADEVKADEVKADEATADEAIAEALNDPDPSALQSQAYHKPLDSQILGYWSTLCKSRRWSKQGQAVAQEILEGLLALPESEFDALGEDQRADIRQQIEFGCQTKIPQEIRDLAEQVLERFQPVADSASKQ